MQAIGTTYPPEAAAGGDDSVTAAETISVEAKELVATPEQSGVIVGM
ncbi:hypothetical protein [Actinoalloteichus caeruleus]